MSREEPVIKMIVKADRQRRIQIPAQIARMIEMKPSEKYEMRLIAPTKSSWMLVILPSEVK